MIKSQITLDADVQRELEILNLFQRIENNVKDYYRIPKELVDLIHIDQLDEVYDFILNNQEILKNMLKKADGIRLAKEDTGLLRTLNIVRDPTSDEFVLILETKHKTGSGAKDKKNIPTFKGANKKGVPAWRVDITIPEKWINLVIKKNYNINNPDSFNKANEAMVKVHKEINLANRMNKKGAAIAQELGHPLFQAYSCGQVFSEPTGQIGKETLKQSIYSPFAICSLSNLSKAGIILTPEDKNDITLSLLKEIKVLHDNGIVHQDIKRENILVYQDQNGKYYAKLADFGMAKKKAAFATYYYESPEVSLSHMGDDYSYYYHDQKRNTISYGQHFGMTSKYSSEETNTFATRHTSNDMWAMGVVLYELYTDKSLALGKDLFSLNGNSAKLSDVKNIQRTVKKLPLIKGLLDPQRSSRFTADDALRNFEKAQPKFKAK